MKKIRTLKQYRKQMFDAPANMTGTDNIDTHVREIDFVTSFQKNIKAFLDILGITRLIRKENGTEMKVRKVVGTLQSGDVGEGELIPASQYRVQEKTLGKIKLKKYKKIVSIEAIADKGYDAAVQTTDDEMKSDIRKDITNGFYAALKMGALCGSKSTFQAAIAAAIGLVKDKFNKMQKTATAVAVWVNTLDLYDYLGNASVTIQTAFGFDYIENFMGAEIVFISSEIEQGKVYATPVNNIVAYYVNPSDGEFSRAGLSYYVDSTTGFIGFTAQGDYDRAVSNAYAITGIRMMCEYIDAIANVDIAADGPALACAAVTDTSTNLLGKICTDLQANVTVDSGVINGTLHYLDDYTGFSGAPAEQVGNFLALVFTSDDGASIQMTNIGGKRDGRTVTLDSDGILIVQIFNEFTQKIKVTATKNGKSTTRTYGLTGLWLEEEGE